MTERMTMANLHERCANLNRRMEHRGADVRYEVSRRYDYTALDRTDGRNSVCLGTKREVGDALHHMMVALDDAELYGETPRYTEEEADVLYGMLVQRLYLREDDPERETVIALKDQVYPRTSAYREAEEAAAELGIDLSDVRKDARK